MKFRTKGKYEKSGRNHEADVSESALAWSDEGMMDMFRCTFFDSGPLSFLIQIRHDQFQLTVVILHDLGRTETCVEMWLPDELWAYGKLTESLKLTVFYIIYSVVIYTIPW